VQNEGRKIQVRLVANRTPSCHPRSEQVKKCTAQRYRAAAVGPDISIPRQGEKASPKAVIVMAEVQ
jgi:hypothetical protein